MNTKNAWITALTVVLVIIVAWYLLDFRSGYPKGPDEFMNASSTAQTEAVVPSPSTSPAPSVSETTTNTNQPTETMKNFSHTITIETNKGTIVFETYDADAPKTVENFITLAQKGFYNNLIFHRVIQGFMIQGGDPTGTGRGGPGYQFADELDPNTPSYKAGYVRGTVAMANAGPNTNGSQFFIMQKDNALPHNYTIFGKVISGLDVVDAIAATPVDGADKPTSDIVMKSVTVK